MASDLALRSLFVVCLSQLPGSVVSFTRPDVVGCGLVLRLLICAMIYRSGCMLRSMDPRLLEVATFHGHLIGSPLAINAMVFRPVRPDSRFADIATALLTRVPAHFRFWLQPFQQWEDREDGFQRLTASSAGRSKKGHFGRRR